MGVNPSHFLKKESKNSPPIDVAQKERNQTWMSSSLSTSISIDHQCSQSTKCRWWHTNYAYTVKISYRFIAYRKTNQTSFHGSITNFLITILTHPTCSPFNSLIICLLLIFWPQKMWTKTRLSEFRILTLP